MDNFFRQLNQKGPGGIPKWIYAAGAVIILYLAYRWFSNRGSSSSSSNSTPDASGVDTSGDATSTDGSSSDPATDSSTDTSLPDSTDTTAPTPSDVSPDLEEVAANTSAVTRLGKKLLAKRGHSGLHDKKQGTSGTKKKAVHSASKNHKQHPKSHAPKKKGVKHSGEKAKATSGIPASRPQAFATVHSTSTPVAVKKVSKANPAPIAAPAAAKRVEAKHPVKKK